MQLQYSRQVWACQHIQINSVESNLKYATIVGLQSALLLMIFNKKYLPTLLALIFGATTVLGFAPYYIFPIPIFAIAGLCYLWAKSGTPKAAWILGFSYGLGLYGVGIYWIYISLHDFGGMPWWFAGFSTLLLVCVYGIVCWFGRLFQQKNKR